VKIIAHRGLWDHPSERNREVAFRRCFELGFGTETDIRDSGGELVIAHDVPTGGEMPFADFLEMARSYAGAAPLTLALNVKSDGLVAKVCELVRDERSLECFFFDMSVPDMRSYLAAGLPTFGRVSEVEERPPWRSQLAGYWLDAFERDWYGPELLRELLSEVRSVAIVSPELHRRARENLWTMLRDRGDATGLVLCTDHPREAGEFFS
jgi:hypothetical protein